MGGCGGGAELLAQKYLLHVGRLIGSLVGPIEPYSGLFELIGAYWSLLGLIEGVHLLKKAPIIGNVR